MTYCIVLFSHSHPHPDGTPVPDTLCTPSVAQAHAACTPAPPADGQKACGPSLVSRGWENCYCLVLRPIIRVLGPVSGLARCMYRRYCEG